MRIAYLCVAAAFAACSSDTKSSDPDTTVAADTVEPDATKADDPDGTVPSTSIEDSSVTSPEDSATTTTSEDTSTDVEPDTTCDECDTVGARECQSASSYRVCELAGNGCRVWNTDEPCTDDSHCDAGVCEPDGPTCEDDCDVSESTCDGDELVRCGQLDGDACLDLLVISCDSRCVAGACNNAPVAALACPEWIALGDDAALDASDSFDDGEIVGYTFSSDLSQPVPLQSSPTIDLPISAAGTAHAKVVVQDDVGLEGSATCDIEVYAIPDAVEQLDAAPGDHAVTLTWTSADYATAYDIFWSTSDDVSTASAIIPVEAGPGATQTFVHTNLTPGTRYFYGVRSKNPAFTSNTLSLGTSAFALYADDLQVDILGMSGRNVCDFSSTCIGYEHEMTYLLYNAGANVIDRCVNVAIDHQASTPDVDETKEHCVTLAPGASEYNTQIVAGDVTISPGATARVFILDADDDNAANDQDTIAWTRPATCHCD